MNRAISLGDLVTIKHGFAFKGEYFTDQVTDKILVTPGNFEMRGGFKSSKLKYYDGPIKTDYILSPGDLIVTMTDLSKEGDTLGYSALVPDNGLTYLHNQRIGLVETKSKLIDKSYLYYIN